MADRQDSDREVLRSLPRSRPVRRSAKRDDPPAAKGKRPTARPKAAAKPESAAAKPQPTAKPKPGAKAASKPRTTSKAKPAPKSPGAPAAGAAPRRSVPPAGYAAPDQRAADAPASGAADLISTTIQAAAELTEIGVTIGRQTLRSMLDKLPKP